MGSYRLSTFHDEEVSAVRRAIITGVLLAASMLLTGCGGDPETGTIPSSTPSATPSSEPTEPEDSDGATAECQGEECTSTEVGETGCDKPANNVARVRVESTQRNRLQDVNGWLELRQSKVERCQGIYWARFRPDGTSTKNWLVWIEVNDGVNIYEDQESVSGPRVAGFTEGVFVRDGQEVTYCLGQLQIGQVCRTAVIERD